MAKLRKPDSPERAKFREKRRRWYAKQENKEKARAVAKERYRADPQRTHDRRKVWVTSNPERARVMSVRATRKFRLKKYGMTFDDYDKLLAKQGGVCGICKQSPKPGKILGVDHCHASGVVRGLLCDYCNQALGLFKDNTQALLSAVDYLNARILTVEE